MVVQVLTHAPEVVRHVDANRPQMRCRTDTREHQQVRAADGTGAQDHFPSCPCGDRHAAFQVSHTDRPAILENDPLDRGLAFDCEVGPCPGRIKVGPCRAPSLALMHRTVEKAETLLEMTVDVVRCRISRILPCLQKASRDRTCRSRPVDMERPAVAPEPVAATEIGFHPLEIGQHVGIGPAFAARLAPSLVVQGMPADVNHAVDGRRAADGLAAVMPDPPTVQFRLRFSDEGPIVSGAFEVGKHGGRHLQGKGIVFRARLEQQDPMVAVTAQTLGEDTACRPRADDDEIEFH